MKSGSMQPGVGPGLQARPISRSIECLVIWNHFSLRADVYATVWDVCNNLGVEQGFSISLQQMVETLCKLQSLRIDARAVRVGIHIYIYARNPECWIVKWIGYEV